MNVRAKIIDPNAAPIAGATVTVENFQGVGLGAGFTDASGAVTLTAADDQFPWQYRVSAPGFAEYIGQPVEGDLGVIMLDKKSSSLWWILVAGVALYYIAKK